MSLRHAVLLSLLCLQPVRAVSFSVDADTGQSGIQRTVVLSDTGRVVAIELAAAHCAEVFSFQCAVLLDTAKFSFVGSDRDYGFMGRRNLLTVNGGSIQGFSQKRANPPRPDIVDLAFTLTGSDESQQVSGDGLLGVLWLKSKMAYGDSGSVKLLSGAWAKLGGTLQTVDTLASASISVATAETFVVSPATQSADTPSASPRFWRSATGIGYRIACTAGRAVPMTVTLFDLSGSRLCTVYDGMAVPGTHEVPLTSARSARSGALLCRIVAGTEAATLRVEALR